MLEIHIQYSFDQVKKKKCWSQDTVACSLINKACTTEENSLVVVNTELKPNSTQDIAFPE